MKPDACVACLAVRTIVNSDHTSRHLQLHRDILLDFTCNATLRDTFGGTFRRRSDFDALSRRPGTTTGRPSFRGVFAPTEGHAARTEVMQLALRVLVGKLRRRKDRRARRRKSKQVVCSDLTCLVGLSPAEVGIFVSLLLQPCRLSSLVMASTQSSRFAVNVGTLGGTFRLPCCDVLMSPSNTSNVAFAVAVLERASLREPVPRPQEAGLLRALARVVKEVGGGAVPFLPEILAAIFALLALHSSVPAYAILDSSVIGHCSDTTSKNALAERSPCVRPREMRVLYVLGKKEAKEASCNNYGYTASGVFWRDNLIDGFQFRDGRIRTACLRCLCEVFDLYPEYDYTGWMGIFMTATSGATRRLPSSAIGHVTATVTGSPTWSGLFESDN